MLPPTIAPMLAQSRPDAFDSDDYLFEIKWDGTRALAFITDTIKIQNRRLISIQERYPELGELSLLPKQTVLDGEIIVLHNGKPSFAKLQQRDSLSDPLRIELSSQRLPATFVAFDLLYLRGQSLLKHPLLERRKLLQDLLHSTQLRHVIHSDYIVGKGVDYYQAIEQQQLEGIMAKRLDSLYLPGDRSSSWLKIKVTECDVYWIIGYIAREDGSAVSALLLGEQCNGRWIYRGKVGSGFNEPQRRALLEHLSQLPTHRYEVNDAPAQAHWITPRLRARIRYFEITKDLKLRSPVFEHFVADD